MFSTLPGVVVNLKHIVRSGLAAIAVAVACATPATAGTPIRVGYWTSGISLGFGAVLEAQKLFEKHGFDPEFVHFPDVTGPTKAIAANSIDLAFGASLAGAFSLGAQGVPVKIILATQVVDAQFVVPADSPIRTLDDLKGKKIGMSPVGSATTGVGVSLLQNRGLAPKDYSLVPGNESRLVQFVVQKDVDAAVLRTLTIAQTEGLASKIRVITSFEREWQAMTKSKSLPYIGVAVVRTDWLQKYPQAGAAAVVAMREALVFGEKNPAVVVDVLKKAANMPDDGAKLYAELWSGMNTVTFEPGDIDTLKRTFEIFKADGTLKGDLPDMFLTKPWNDAKAMR